MKKPIRVLHVLGAMERAGIETWLMHLLRNIDRDRYSMEFLVLTDRRAAYDDEIESLGSKLHVCLSPSSPLQFSRKFLRVLREQGPFDVIHSHVHYYSGLILRLSALAGAPVRIAHSHTDTRLVDAASPLPRRLYMRLSREWIRRYATRRLAASVPAADSLFGPDWRSDPATSIIYCGLDFAPFGVQVDRAAVRRELGLGESDFVVGHVGRFVPPKNHDLLLRIHAEMLRLRPDARLLLIGGGPLEKDIRETANRMGTADRLCFAGDRPDVARLMLGAMDVFVMPSLFEGLGLAAVESQAAGLPTILSSGVPPEADTGCGLVRFVPVGASPSNWARRVLEHAKQTSVRQADALACVIKSRFNIQRSIPAICQLYSHGLEPQ